MYIEGASAQIAREMEGYKFWGISECRWTGARRMRTASGQTINYSGNEELHEEEVVIMISRYAGSEITHVMDTHHQQNQNHNSYNRI